MEASEKPLNSRWPTGIILIAVLCGIVVRFSQLGRMSLWFDEGYTAWVVSLSPSQVLRAIRADTSPPLYYLLLRGWVGMFGHSEAAMRSLSALFSSVALLISCKIAGRLLYDRWAVAAAVCLSAVSCMTVSYAHEARFYAFTLFLGAIDFYLLLLVAERSSIKRLALLAVAWIASLYTSNIMGIYLAAMGLAWPILPGHTPMRRRFVDLFTITVIASVAYLPWLPTMLVQMHALHGNFWATQPDYWTLARAVSVLCGINEHAVPTRQETTLVVLEAILLSIFLASLFDRCIRRADVAVVIVGLGPVLLVFVMSRIGQPIFVERAFLPTALFSPLLISLPLNFIRASWQRWLYVAMLGVLMVLSIRSTAGVWLGEHAEPWREMCQYVDADQSTHPLIVFAANEGEILYDYYSRLGDYSPRPDLIGLPADFFAVDPPRTMHRVRSDSDLDPLRAALARNRYTQVVVIESHPWWADPSHRIPDFLGRHMSLIGTKEFPNTTIYRYSFDR